MTAKTESAAELVAKTEKRFPNAVRLARVVSLASRIEPELLRQARLQLLPTVDAGAEADLWFSPLVQSSTPLAITLVPVVADLLRRELAQSPESLQRAWELLKELHQNAPAAIRLEERVTFETLAHGAGSLERVENELMSVVSAISEQKRSGLARWALRAVPRLPEEARQTQAATTLVLTAAQHLEALHLLDQQLESNTLAAGFINQLQIVLPPDLPRVLVGVRLLEKPHEPGSNRQYVVEFSYPPLLDLNVISVPATVPLMLEVSWNDSSQEQIKNLNLYQGRTETVAIGANTVNIRTAGGDIYTLREDTTENVSAPLTNATRALIPAPPDVGYITRRYSGGRDIAESLKAELAPGRNRLIQIWGPGGAGKTVIAAHVARELMDAFNQRVIWKSAEGRSDFNINTLLDGIASQLGRVDLWTLKLSDKVREVKALLSAHPTLIFIDDFEVIEKKFRTRILNFLRGSDGVAVIISRPRIDGVYHIVIGRMLPEEATEFLTRLIKEKLSHLFGDVGPRTRIIETCEGNPLAMRWLLAQIDVTGNVEAALEGVEKKRKDDAVSRVFDSSFKLPQLGDDGRRALRTLLLFVPSASRTALLEIAGFATNVERFDEAVKILARLELIRVSGERIEIAGLIRRLMPAVPTDISQRFLSYFLTYVQQHSSPTPENYDALEAEFENVLDAMDIAIKSKLEDSVIEFGTSLSSYFFVRGYWDEALRRNQQAESAARMKKRNRAVLQLKEASADIYLRRRQLNKAAATYDFLVDQYQRSGDRAGVARMRRHLGSIALEQDRLNEAERSYSEALRISREIHSDAGIADNLHNLAIVAQEKGSLAKARRLYLDSLKLSSSLNDDRSVAISLHQLGVIALENRNYSEADRFLRQSLETKRKLQDRSGMADTLHQLGLLRGEQGKIEEAKEALREALEIFIRLGSPSAREVEEDLNALFDAESHSESRVPEQRQEVTRRSTKKATKGPARKSTTKNITASVVRPRTKKPSKKSAKTGRKTAGKGARKGIGGGEKLFRPRRKSFVSGAGKGRMGGKRFSRASAKAYK